MQGRDTRFENTWYKFSIVPCYNAVEDITCLFIDAELWNSRTSAPGSQLGHFVHQSRWGIVFSTELQDNTEMVRKALQSADILANEFGGAVVVVDDSEDTIDDGVVGLE